jgi:glyoxylase-like metal-dependent hydrolase (beta-lactamase superfamily II)
MRFVVMLIVAALVVPLSADNGETTVERSHERARQVLEAALEAIGGRAAVQDVKAVRIRMDGQSTPRHQNPTAEPPYAPGTYHEETVLDLAGNRMAVIQKTSGSGFRGHARIVVDGNEAWNFDLLNRTVTPVSSAGAQQQFVQYQRRLPSLLLQTALQREATLRYLGEDTIDGRKHDVITFVHQDGVQTALYVNAVTNLIGKYELIYPDAVTGDEASEIYFTGYRPAGTLLVPSTFVWKLAGDVVANWAYDVAFDPQIADATFDAGTTGFHALPANAAQQRPVGVEKIGDGVYLVNNLGGGAYNAMAVEFADHVLVVEAPISSQVSERAIQEIKGAIPGKPIRYVAITHHHSDHSGGLRAFVAEGAAVVTTRGNEHYVKSLVASRQLRDALAGKAAPLKLEFVENKKRVFSDGTQTVELYDIGPNPHAREMLIAYLPKQRIAFQGDMFFSPFDGQPVGFAQEATRSFAARVRELGLGVDKLAGVHGKVGAMSEVQQALELAKTVESSTEAGGRE